MKAEILSTVYSSHVIRSLHCSLTSCSGWQGASGLDLQSESRTHSPQNVAGLCWSHTRKEMNTFGSGKDPLQPDTRLRKLPSKWRISSIWILNELEFSLNTLPRAVFRKRTSEWSFKLFALCFWAQSIFLVSCHFVWISIFPNAESTSDWFDWSRWHKMV